MTVATIDEDEQIYIALSSLDVFLRVWAGGGQLASVSVNGRTVPIDATTGLGELNLGVGSTLKGTTIDLDAAFLKVNPLSASAFLNFELFQRRAGAATKLNLTGFGPLEVAFDGGTQAQRQTSVSIV
jgi:hypothetical protein